MSARAFASAALVALVVDGLARQGIAPPAEAPAAPALRRAPLLPHGRKRALLDAVLAAHGPLPLLRVGEAVEAQRFQPMLHALLRAETPADLLGRWLRLESYAHSHHRCLVEHMTPDGVRLRHVSQDATPPSAAEDLLVLGMVVALLRAIGAGQVCAALDGRIVAQSDGSWDVAAAQDAAHRQRTAQWVISWGAMAPRAAQPPPTLPLEFPVPEAAALARLFAADPARHLPLCEAAAMLGLGPRALQRRLAPHGLTAVAVKRAVQVRIASSLLAEGDEPLPAIGFICGFSDQAHFTREFRRQVAMTPGAYRRLFQPG